MLDSLNDFPQLKRTVGDRRIVYLDSAATSLKPQQVIDAVVSYYTQSCGAVHRGLHLLADEATDAFENARSSIARFLNASLDEIVVTPGTSEAIGLVKHSNPHLKRFATTPLEHHSNLLPWRNGDSVKYVKVDAEGVVDLEDLESTLKEGVDLLSIGHISNVIGTCHPVEQMIELAHKYGALVLLDAAQSAPHMRLDVKELDVDFLVCSAHKMLGPGGAGLLYGKRSHLTKMTPTILGSSMVETVTLDQYELRPPPGRFEVGSPATEALIGWGAAIRYLNRLGMTDIEDHCHTLTTLAFEKLSSIPGVTILGPQKNDVRLSILSFYVKGLEAHAVARMLNHRANVMVRSGFHCAQPLHTSLNSPPSVRASFYVYNSKEDVDLLAEQVAVISNLAGM